MKWRRESLLYVGPVFLDTTLGFFRLNCTNEDYDFDGAFLVIFTVISSSLDKS